MAVIVFYTHAPAQNLNKIEFYKQDIDALKALGHEVVVCTKLREIPAKFDAMFIWWWTRALLPVLLCRILKRPSIITGTFDFRFPDTFRGTDYFRRPFWQRLLIRLAVRSCSLNLFVNKLELEQCKSHFGLQNVGYMPHCVPDDYLQGPSQNKTKALFNIAWSGKDNLIRKGIPELLRAIRTLKDREVKVDLFLAGLEGDGRPSLLESIRQLGLEEEVHYLGAISREEKIKMLREIEVYVQPSHYEGFGVAILEAMGCGACVIVCDVGAVKEVVADSGVYVSPSNPEELARTIERVLRDDLLRSEMQMRAVSRASSEFTFGKKVERLGAFLQSLHIEQQVRVTPGAPMSQAVRVKSSSI